MGNKVSLPSKATIFKNSLNHLREEPHFGLVNGILDAFQPKSALLLGSSPKTAKILHSRVNRLMAVDFEQSRFNKNLSDLTEKAEFYAKSFKIYDDHEITGDEGLILSNLYKRIKNFFKNSDLLVIDQPSTIALGAFNFFSDINDIIVIRGIDPISVNNKNFSKYRMITTYGDVSSLLLKKHLSVKYNAIRDIIYEDNIKFYQELNITPIFKFEEA